MPAPTCFTTRLSQDNEVWRVLPTTNVGNVTQGLGQESIRKGAGGLKGGGRGGVVGLQGAEAALVSSGTIVKVLFPSDLEHVLSTI